MEIKVLGTGCAKCRKLYAEAEKAVAEVGLPVTLVKVEDLDDILAYGVMMTPALVLDEKVRASGRVPKASEIAGWIRG